MRPPFVISPRVLSLAQEIERLVGRAEGLEPVVAQPLLRKRNRVRSIRASAAIEGNTLTEEQVTALLDGKRVIGDRKELLEITNANTAYASAPSRKSTSVKDLLAAHRELMTGLVADAGRFRTLSVGVLDGSKATHVAPPSHLVRRQVTQLLKWLGTAEVPPLIRACVAHYELLFIHPFMDGNGRLARLWQHVILLEASPVFSFVPTESVIRDRQQQYYEALRRCDRKGDCTEFVELVLEALRDALRETLEQLRPQRVTAATRIERAQQALGGRWFSRADWLRLFPTIATATASRDLAEAVAAHRLEKKGDRRLARYRFPEKAKSR